eukprot:6455544-Pyramimonas_sp.AAC.1
MSTEGGQVGWPMGAEPPGTPGGPKRGPSNSGRGRRPHQYGTLRNGRSSGAGQGREENSECWQSKP